MDFLTKNRFTIWTIVILVVLNLTTLTLVWLDHFKPHPPFPPPGTGKDFKQSLHFLKNELNLSETQIQKFIESRNRHVIQSKEILDKVYRLKKEILDEMFFTNPDSLEIQKLTEKIGLEQAEFERILFKHFLELKSFCKPGQQEKLKFFLHDVFEITRPPEPQIP